MAVGYSRQFLIDAFLSRYYSLPTEKFEDLEKMAEAFYDEVGKDKFRTYCSLDAEAIQKFKLEY